MRRVPKTAPTAPPLASKPKDVEDTADLFPAETTALAMPGNVFAAGFGADTVPEAHVAQTAPASGGRAPYLSFYHPQQKVADLVVDACKTADQGVGVGMPYLGNIDESFERVDSAGFVIWGTHLPYWCTIDDGGQLADVWLEPQAVFEEKVDRKTGKTRNVRVLVDGLKMHGSCLAMLLFLPGRRDLSDALAPATLAIADVRKNHQSGSVLRAFDASQKAKTRDAIKKLGPIVSQAPAGLRFVSRFLITPKSGKITWALADSTSAPLTETQLAAVMAWGSDQSLQDERERIEEIFETRVAEIKAKAAETAGN